MIDSLSINSFTTDYYQYYPLKNDGMYLNHLVHNCQSCIEILPSYSVVRQKCLELTELYRDLQVYKHLDPSNREVKLKHWATSHQQLAPELFWWEFAAATGSTLTIFALIKEASKKNLTHKHGKNICDIYFPWISGLHILLDYLIDEKEDIEQRDLNFLTYYDNRHQMKERLLLFIQKSLEGTKRTSDKNFHEIIVKGLLAMYLSDPKVSSDYDLNKLALELIDYAGPDTKTMYKLCLGLRKFKKL